MTSPTNLFIRILHITHSTTVPRESLKVRLHCDYVTVTLTEQYEEMYICLVYQTANDCFHSPKKGILMPLIFFKRP